MENGFVRYLNTMHNASGSNEHAIAENNISEKDAFSSKILFERNITEKIIETLTTGVGKIVILTGHAGDGKTSILQEIVRRCTGREMDSCKLKDEFAHESQRKIHYIKDMSEHERKEQIQIFRDAICAVKKEESVILISNTGPLFHVLQELGMEEERIIEVLDTTQLKENTEDFPEYPNVPIVVANLALFDNSDIIGKFLEKAMQEELWSDCQDCEKREYCPICFNQENIRENKKQVTDFCEWFYRWNFEHGERFTVRQILAHLSYSITGNKNCENIAKLVGGRNQKRILYNTFSNLFFGHHYENGQSVQDVDALQIKPVKLIQKQRLDTKKIPAEYALFVQNDLHIFRGKMEELLNTCKAGEIGMSEEKKEYYRVIKRAYYMYHQKGEEENKSLQKAVFSEMFSDYIQLQNSENIRRDIIMNIKRITFHGLHVLFMGMPPGEDDKIYLTVRRRGSMLQNVQISQGVIYKGDLDIHVDSKENVTNGKKEKIIQLFYHNMYMDLTLPVLEYFKELESGLIQNKIDPRLSQGVENIKAKLYQARKKNTEDLTIVYSDGIKFQKAEVIVDDSGIWIQN
ncbi:MAG: ATP-binding protein [Lachnospiraceae bacterium]|nr:ATP-binding protein [Lachnospiraceae bacterium]